MSKLTGSSTLIYAIRPRVLAKYGGQLSLILALLCLPPLVVATVYGELDFAWRFAVLAILLTLAAFWSRRISEPERIRRNEGLALTCAAFIVSPLLVGFALMPAQLPIVDILFETISGITTTGLSTISAIETQSPTFLFTRAFMQWYGGLGIVVLSVALLMHHQTVAMPWIETAPGGENLIATLRTHALHMLKVYMVLTVLALIISYFLLDSWFDALIHTLSAVSTGGFSTHSDSLAGLGSSAQIGMIAIAVCGAISLPLYYLCWNREWRTVLQNGELRVYLCLLLFIGGLFSLLYWATSTVTLEDSLRIGFVMGLSAQSTTGFANVSIHDLAPALKLLLIYAMLIGGCIASTAGGIKIFRLVVLYRVLQNDMQRSATTEHAMVIPRIGDRPLEADEIRKALLIAAAMLITCLLSWFPFLLYGYPPMDSLFEVVSAVGTVGLSTGITAVELPLFLKGVLCFDMLAGRVEVLALLSLLYPRNWIGRKEIGT